MLMPVCSNCLLANSGWLPTMSTHHSRKPSRSPLVSSSYTCQCRFTNAFTTAKYISIGLRSGE